MVHRRPFIVFANLTGPVQSRYARLRSLTASMGLTGDYAIHPEKQMRLLFELERDASAVASVVKAEVVEEETGSAKRWMFAYDDTVERAIDLFVPATERRQHRTPARRRGNRRSLPF